MRSKPSRTVRSLTGIRGVTALWVVLYHVQIIGTINGYYLNLPTHILNATIGCGWLGVDLFFLLSGFMLMHSHAKQFSVKATERIGQFMRARIYRVYPLSLICLGAVLVLVTVYPAFAAHFRSEAYGNLSLSSFVLTALLATRWFPQHGNWNEPVWSLSAEIIGYCAFPWMAFGIGRIESFGKAIGLTAIAIALVIIGQYGRGRLGEIDLGWTGALLQMAGYFTAGVGLRRAAALWQPDRGMRYLKAAAIMAAITIPVLAMFPLGRAAVPIAFAVIIFVLYYQVGSVNHILGSDLAYFFGNISFPLYLIHVMPIQALIFHARASGLSSRQYRTEMLLLLAGIILLSWVLHRFVEKPFFTLARRRNARAMD